MDFDVVVVGAGAAGCMAAKELARFGLNVGLFDTSMRSNLGKTIIVEVERTIFGKVGVAFPTGDEAPYQNKHLRVFSSRGREVFSLKGENPGAPIYLDRFVKRLLAEAEAAGALFFENNKAVEPIISQGRVCGAVFEEGGVRKEIKARLTIDASGFQASIVRRLDPSLGISFIDRPQDIVSAGNAFHEIDEAKAREAIGRGLCGAEEIWVVIGNLGNYSTKYFYVSLSDLKAYILIGLKDTHKNAPQMSQILDDFKNEQGYYGAKLYGNIAKIRISSSLDRLVTDGFMAIGEAACQVIPLHASGVASGLYAGYLAAQTAGPVLKTGGIPSTADLWPYAMTYKRKRGADLAVFNAIRLVSESMTEDQVAGMLESGVLDRNDYYHGLIPNIAPFTLGSLPKRIYGFIKRRDLIAPITKMLALATMLKIHYAFYPSKYDPASIQKWSRKNQKIFKSLYDRL